MFQNLFFNNFFPWLLFEKIRETYALFVSAGLSYLLPPNLKAHVEIIH